MSARSDADVIRDMANGSRSALGELYDRYGALVHTLALRIVRQPPDAEEVAQDAFLQAWRQAGRFDSARGTASAWLVTMTRSRALDRLRRRGSHSTVEVTDTTLVSDPDPGAPAVNRAVQHALGRLPAEQRRAIELAYYQGLSQSEIAEHTGDPLGTVKTRIRLGLGRLREALQEEAT